MEWWTWVLIGVGVVALGAIKLAIFKKMKQSKEAKKKFTDED
ncbi:hypothetical protein [Mobilitalea sibirica]|nr:hypothetical protein [Mobilitalea sibirica]